MHFKLIITFSESANTEKIQTAARNAGATGSTIISNARGEGLTHVKTFFGLSVERPIDVSMYLVEEHLSRAILEAIDKTGEFDKNEGIAFQLDIEDAVGIGKQIESLNETVEEKL